MNSTNSVLDWKPDSNFELSENEVSQKSREYDMVSVHLLTLPQSGNFLNLFSLADIPHVFKDRESTIFG